jgi:hypothetical protein
VREKPVPITEAWSVELSLPVWPDDALDVGKLVEGKVSVEVPLLILLDVSLDVDMPMPKATKSPKPCILVEEASL